MRDLTERFIKAINSEHTDEVFLVLLTLSHSEWIAPFHFVNNNENITSRGQEYIAYPFEIILPSSLGDSLPSVTLKIDNVDRRITDELRKVIEPINIQIEVILASEPDIVEVGPFKMEIRSADYETLTIEGTLSFDYGLFDTFPSDEFIPSLYPGLF